MPSFCRFAVSRLRKLPSRHASLFWKNNVFFLQQVFLSAMSAGDIKCTDCPSLMSWYVGTPHLIVKLQSWSVAECIVSVYFHYSQVNSDPDCEYILRFNLLVKEKQPIIFKDIILCYLKS